MAYRQNVKLSILSDLKVKKQSIVALSPTPLRLASIKDEEKEDEHEIQSLIEE